MTYQKKVSPCEKFEFSLASSKNNLFGVPLTRKIWRKSLFIKMNSHG